MGIFSSSLHTGLGDAGQGEPPRSFSRRSIVYHEEPLALIHPSVVAYLTALDRVFCLFAKNDKLCRD